MTERYDVIVVGAGPAGVSTALYARRRGLSVLLVDKRHFPRDKVCGDGVAGRAVDHLRALGLLDEVRAAAHEPVAAAILGAPSGAEARFDLTAGGAREAPYLICCREVFDDVLVRAARREVDVLEGWAVDDILRAPDGGVRGIRCRGERDEEREIATRVVVGADGFNSIVARRLGLYRYDRRRWIAATRQYVRGLDVPPQTVQIHFVDDTLPGYFWIFPAANGTANVGVGSGHAALERRGGLRRMHERVVSSDRFQNMFATATDASEIRGWNLPTPDRRRTVCGDGFLLVGDAAGLVDPFTGEGIGSAMASGDVAARTIADALHRADAGHVNLSGYAPLLWEELDEKEFALHYKLRALARHRALIDLVVGRAAKHTKTLDWLARMTYEADGIEQKRALLSPLTYLRLLLGRRG